MTTFTVVIVAFFVFAFIFVLRATPFTISSHWQTFLDGIQLSADDFYELIREGLKERQITQVNVGQESFLERHLFSAKRLYLRISQGEYVIYVCAAPYGTGTFVSSWLCTTDENLLNRIPFISKFAGKDRNNKTFYQMDTEAMFRSAVHSTVLAAVDRMAVAKGNRGLTEFERQYVALK